MKKNIAQFICAFFGILSFSFCQTPSYPTVEEATSIDEFFNAFVPQTMGVSVGVYDNGKMTYHHYGKTSADNINTPNDHSIYEIGSISKTFTAALLNTLDAQKIVDKQNHIADYLPKGTCPWQPDTAPISLQDLSTHTSGFSRLPSNLTRSFMANGANPYAAYTHDELLEAVQNLTVNELTDRTHVYSNFGAGLLGEILAMNTDQSYADLLQKELLSKLNMSNTFIDVPQDHDEHFLIGYDERLKETSHWDLPALAGAGAIKSDIVDMTQYLKSNIEENQLLKETHDVRIDVDDYTKVGLGWLVQPQADGSMVHWHNGGTGGFRTVMMFDKSKHKGIVVLTNSANSADQVASLAFQYLIRE